MNAQTPFALVAIPVVIADYFGLLSTRCLWTPRIASWVWAGGLVASYVVELLVQIHIAQGQLQQLDPWRSLLPIPVIDDRVTRPASYDGFTVFFLLTAALQSFALLGLYRSKPSWKLVVAGFIAFAGLSIAAPVLLSSDIYAYVHDFVLGRFASYDPPNVPLPGDYHVIDYWYGRPFGSLYGPLNQSLLQLSMGIASGFYAKLLAWRTVCVVSFAAMLVGLRAYGMPLRMVAVAALNPAFFLQFVLSAHNDIVPIALIAIAAALIRRYRFAAVGIIGLASLIKAPYLGVSVPVLAQRFRGWRIVVPFLAVLAIFIAGYRFGLGPGFVSGLEWYLTAKGVTRSAPQYAGLAIALALLALSVFQLRRLRSGVWIMSMLSQWPFAWYFVWGLPYALAQRRTLSYFFVIFPLLTMCIDSAFYRWWQFWYVIPAIGLAAVFVPKTTFKQQRLQLFPESANRVAGRKRKRRKTSSRASDRSS